MGIAIFRDETEVQSQSHDLLYIDENGKFFPHHILIAVQETSIFFFRFLSHFYVGSMFLMRCLHLTRSCASSPDNSLSDKSFLMLSDHLRFGLPLLLFPGTSITITLLPTYSSSVLNTCPDYFNQLSCTLLDISATFIVSLSLSFLILSSLVTPLIHLNNRSLTYRNDHIAASSHINLTVCHAVERTVVVCNCQFLSPRQCGSSL